MAGFTDETGRDAAGGMGDIEEMFTFQQATELEVEKMGRIRADAMLLARTIVTECPADYSRSIAIQRIREAVMWANAGIMLQGRVS